MMLKGDEKISLDYAIVQANSPRELEKYVKVRFSVGWGLQGGVCVFRVHACEPVYSQAMTKRY